MLAKSDRLGTRRTLFFFQITSGEKCDGVHTFPVTKRLAVKPEYVKERNSPGRAYDGWFIQIGRFRQPQAMVSQGRDYKSAWVAGKVEFVLVPAIR